VIEITEEPEKKKKKKKKPKKDKEEKETEVFIEEDLDGDAIVAAFLQRL
jgi:hypothetical protein